MKKISLIIVGLVLMLTFAGCTRGSYASNAGNKPLGTASASAATMAETAKAAKEPTTEEPTTEVPTVSEQGNDYNAEDAQRAFEESDIPDSIKNIFLANGDFVDTQTNTALTLKDYKIYETKLVYDESDPNAVPKKEYNFENWKNVVEWSEYLSVDFDDDGKKELLFVYWVDSGNHQGVIFHEHTDGKVYAYGHQSLRVNIGENGDVVGSFGADLTAHILERYSFDTEKIIKTKIAYAENQEDGVYKYYGEGREISEAEFGSYMKLVSEGGMPWTKYIIVPTN